MFLECTVQLPLCPTPYFSLLPIYLFFSSSAKGVPEIFLFITYHPFHFSSLLFIIFICARLCSALLVVNALMVGCGDHHQLMIQSPRATRTMAALAGWRVPGEERPGTTTTTSCGAMSRELPRHSPASARSRMYLPAPAVPTSTSSSPKGAHPPYPFRRVLCVVCCRTRRVRTRCMSSSALGGGTSGRVIDSECCACACALQSKGGSQGRPRWRRGGDAHERRGQHRDDPAPARHRAAIPGLQGEVPLHPQGAPCASSLVLELRFFINYARGQTFCV